jgi:signal transduction histidine kinase
MRTFAARLNSGGEKWVPLDPGSRLEVTGVYSAARGYRAAGHEIAAFELLIDSPQDIRVVARPAWWTLRRALLIVGSLAVVLGVAVVWITLLHRQVESRTRDLCTEVENHKETASKLEIEKVKLEDEIEERKRVEREVEKAHRQLLDVSRRAGQAEVASSVLHNVGNVLNSVTVSTSLITDRLRGLHGSALTKAADLLASHQEDLGRWLAEDPRGRQFPGYLTALGRHLADEGAWLEKEFGELTLNVGHIKEVVATQQNYARVAGIAETIAPAELLENALNLEIPARVSDNLNLVREYETVAPVTVDKHRVLQILVNLLRNARHACEEGPSSDKRVVVRIKDANSERVRIEVIDNGVGISAENLGRIFTHGFTTRKDGHGFGLHSSVLAARELGGELTVQSDGLGKGAAFALEIPRQLKQAAS